MPCVTQSVTQFLLLPNTKRYALLTPTIVFVLQPENLCSLPLDVHKKVRCMQITFWKQEAIKLFHSGSDTWRIAVYCINYNIAIICGERLLDHQRFSPLCKRFLLANFFLAKNTKTFRRNEFCLRLHRV